MEWAVARYKDGDHEAVKNAILSSNEKVHAYDTKFVDEEFKLVSEVLETLTNVGNNKR